MLIPILLCIYVFQQFIQAIGRACGELVNALEKCDLSPTYTVDQQPNTRFYEIYKQHWMTTRENFFGALKDREEFNASPDVRKYVDLLGEEVIMAEGQLQKMHDSNLPVQLIHADLHYDNVLVEGFYLLLVSMRHIYTYIFIYMRTRVCSKFHISYT
jgi:hypothetical protein